jgi:hypothetical protein
VISFGAYAARLTGFAGLAYSNNALAPTVLSGSESVTLSGTVSSAAGSVVGGVSPTSDYVAFTVPNGFVFRGFTLTSFNSVTDGRGFVGLMPGSQWTAVPNTSNGSLPGATAYSHFGTRGVCELSYLDLAPSGTNNCVINPVAQSNLFSKSLGTPPTVPLPAGSYTAWIQQTGATPIGYQFVAQFTPVPGPLPILGVATGPGFSRRLRRRIKGQA